VKQLKKCLNCGTDVPPYFVKYCSVYCRKDIRRWATLSYVQYRKKYCERCLEKPALLHFHHLNGNPADNRQDNLITVCQPCHTLLHKHESRRKRKRKLNNYLGWMLGHYNVPGGKETPKPKGILDHFM
jgi:endogenous inhibitor of DNA gyrase (YacG/DUF329 family)